MNLESRIKSQFPVLIVTLLSVLIGLDFSDLVGIARGRMTLWPLEVETIRTWGQILTMAGCCLSVWIIFAHLNISRLRIPTLADSVVVFAMPLVILFGNSLVGERETWPWMIWASAYLVLATLTWWWQVHIALKDSELASFSRLTHPFRAMSVLYVGVPMYAIAGWADAHGFLSPTAEAFVTLSGGPIAMFTAWLFIREWRRSLAQSATAQPKL